jgi:hypothetical protein
LPFCALGEAERRRKGCGGRVDWGQSRGLCGQGRRR